MNRKKLLIEADMQSKEIKKLSKWLRSTMAISTIGFVITCFGANNSIPLAVLGGVVLLLSILASIIINMAIKNGKENVKKILELAEVK